MSNIKIYKYSIELKKGISVGNSLLRIREGLILKCIHPSGVSNYGEIAPLPGLSKETIDEVMDQLRDMKNEIREGNIKLAGLYPSVRCGLEAVSLKSHSTVNEVQVNALLYNGDKTMISDVNSLVRSGFSSIKIKLSLSNVKKAVHIINEIIRKLKNKVSLRIDANRAWTLNKALEFAGKIDKSVIDYIEEPFESRADIESFYKETGIGMALDESVKEDSFNINGIPKGIKAIVVKPMIIGGMARLLSIVDLAYKKNIKVVISSSFESGVGISILANMASSLSAMSPAGLDTIKYFKKDILNKPINITKGFMKVPDIRLLDKTINMSMLKEIL